MKHLFSKKNIIGILFFVLTPMVSFSQIDWENMSPTNDTRNTPGIVDWGNIPTTNDTRNTPGIQDTLSPSTNTIDPGIAPTNLTGSNVISNPLIINDAGSKYRPITPQYEQLFGGFSSFEGMLQRIFEISVYFTVILSVIMIIIGGIEYMGSESVFKKTDGKARIFAAIGGLLIALISILVISTILPGGSGNAFRINIFNE